MKSIKKRTIMTTLTKVFVATLLSLLLFSCNFDINFGPGVKGNGHVVEEDRNLKASFSAIKASEGLRVHLTQSDTQGITVEADENLHNLIITEVVDGVLKIHCKQNIGSASAKTIKVRFKDLSKIISTSGSDVYVTNTIKKEHLELKLSSGSAMKLEVATNTLTCESSSGSHLKVSGKTNKLVAEASSGSSIKAENLKAESSQVKASSGAGITVNTSKELVAKASSGGNIKYYGNPDNIEKNNSASGSIMKQ